MKILLEQEGGHLVMLAMPGDDDIDPVKITSWDIGIDDIAVELNGRQGVKRMSYDTWHWDLRKHQEAEEYITYFYLKHG